MVTPATQEPVSHTSEIREQARLDAMPLLITVPCDCLAIRRSAVYRRAATGEFPTTRLGAASTWSPHA